MTIKYTLPEYPKTGELVETAKMIRENKFCRNLSYENFVKYIVKIEESRAIGLMCDYIINFHDRQQYEKIVDFISFLKTKTLPPKLEEAMLFVTKRLKSEGLQEARVDYSKNKK